jgi:hypothetical protein
MIRFPFALMLGCAALAACNDQPAQNKNKIRVVSAEQQQLHKLDAYNLGIGLKRAIYDAGYTCKTVTDGGFVGTWENLDQWTAHCTYDKGPPQDWAIFAGPDGSAQVRTCADTAKSGLPACNIKQRPSGSFLIGGTGAKSARKGASAT